MSTDQQEVKQVSAEDGQEVQRTLSKQGLGPDLMKSKTFEHPNFGKGKHRINDDAVNHQFRRKLWDGQVPVKITLNHKDITSNKNPRSLYMMIPRLNYLTICLEKIKAFFDEYVPADLAESPEAFSDMWMEFDRQPLKWDQPIGVQFDAHVGLGNDRQTKAQQLPWDLIFHYKGCPDDVMARLSKNGGIIGIKYIHFNYINSLKESHVLRMGSANEILAQMKKNEEEKLLDGINKHSYELFWEINQPLLDKHVADMKKYAIRIISNRFSNVLQPCFEIEQFSAGNFEEKKESSEYLTIWNEWEQNVYDQTIGQVFIKAFPALFVLEVEGETSQIRPTKQFDIVCHGLKIDLNTPLYWLQLNMTYLDNFVYLSFHCY